MISLNWVKDYIDIESENLKELALKITKAGVNVEKVITNRIDNLVIGEIKECEIHPDSDHLHVCKVDIGTETLQIVCGAPNARVGIKVIVAKIGCLLPGNFEIKKGCIRGIESSGMMCALFELGLEEKTEEIYNKGIMELGSNAIVGEDPLKYLGLDDTLYELDVHKHRNNDCYYHIGFAYEIGAILNKKVHLPQSNFECIKEDVKEYVKLNVNTSKCPYYLGRIVKDVQIQESPDFIKKRLESAGMRSINNVVDISNYVMLEYGQPLHFFDKNKLGDTVLVRDAYDNEKIVTLDEKERILSSSDIVITDSKKPVCIAGVTGGLNTDIDEKTNTIFIESAIFDATSIRYTASKLNLRSEASIRYGKGLNYEYTLKAIDRACHLLQKYANAKVLSGTLIHDSLEKKEKKVIFTNEDINSMLGINISKEDVEQELNRLEFKYEIDNDKFIATIPNRRLDIDPNINDIAEEIGRLYGYHNLVSTLPKVELKKGQYIGDVKYRKLISKRLRTLGLNESKTYTLVSQEMADLFKYEEKENIVLPNPMSMDKSVVRTTILPSLLNVYEYNKARKVKDILLYEIGKTYDVDFIEDTKISVLMKGNYIYNNWQKSGVKVDFYLIKGIAENILDYLGLKNRYTFEKGNISNMHPGISAKILLDREEIGIIGRIHPALNKDDIYLIEISLNKLIKDVKSIKYKQASRYPEISKDLAFVVKKDVPVQELLNQIRKSGGRLLSDIDIFDVYTGDNVKEDEKSIAFSLVFSDCTKTLSDTEVTEVFSKIIKEVEERCNAKLRDN